MGPLTDTYCGIGRIICHKHVLFYYRYARPSSYLKITHIKPHHPAKEKNIRWSYNRSSKYLTKPNALLWYNLQQTRNMRGLSQLNKEHL